MKFHSKTQERIFNISAPAIQPGIVHPKMTICLKFIHPHVFQDVDKFVFLIGIDLEKFSSTSLVHQRILCSEWVPSEWEFKQLIKNIIIIHMTLVHQLTSCKVESCVCNKQIIIKTLSIILLSLNQERNMHRSSTVYKSKTNVLVYFVVKRQ